jgi:hypothetical protein
MSSVKRQVVQYGWYRSHVGVVLAASVAAAVLGGCASERHIAAQRDFVPAEAPAAFDDSAWGEVLLRYVRDGRVDYAALSKDREPLERFVAMVSVVGPRSTPHLFTSRQARLCYYVNAYNALVVRAVFEQWPVETVHALSLPPLEHGYRFTVGRESVTLVDLRDKTLAEAGDDPRVRLMLCAAAVGNCELASMPYRPVMLEDQLRQAAARAVASRSMVRVDHSRQELLVGQEMFAHQREFTQWYQRRYRSEEPAFLNVLLAMANEPDRRRLNDATGYRVKMLPFDRALNSQAQALLDAGK